MTFSLRVAFDDKPLKASGVQRFSLIFAGDGGQEVVIRGFLLAENPKDIQPPRVMLSGGKSYSVAVISPALQQGLLESMEDQGLLGSKKPNKASQLQPGTLLREFVHGTR